MLNDQFNGSILPKRAAFQIGLVALVTAGLAMGIRWQASRDRLIRLLILLGPLATIVILYWLRAPSAYLAGPLAMNWLLACALALFLSLLAIRLDDFRRLLTGLVAGATLTALIGIAQYLFDVDWFKQATPVAASTFLNKNFAAHYLAVALPASMGLVFLAKSHPTRILATVALVLIGAYLVYVRSLNAWLAGLAVPVVFFGIILFRWRKNVIQIHRPALICLAGALLAIIAASYLPPAPNQNPAQYSPRGLQSVGDAAKLLIDPSLREDKTRYSKLAREALYRNTWLMIRENEPFGVGIGQLTAEFPRYANRFPPQPLQKRESFENYTHNDYLQWVAEFGIPGAIALACLIGGSIWMLFQTTKRATPDNLILLAVTAGMLLANGMIACFSFPFYRDLHPVLLALSVAVLIHLKPDETEAKVLTLQPGKRARVLATLIAATLLGTLAWKYQTMLKADQLYIRSAYANRDGDIDTLRELTDATLELDPQQPWALTNAGVLKLNANKPSEALAHFETIQRNFPYATENLIHLGLAYTRLQRYPEAIKALKQALENRPGYEKAIVPLTNAHLLYASQLIRDPNKKRETAKHIQRILQLAPDHPQANDLRAHLKLLEQ